jgi:hypothetical protein
LILLSGRRWRPALGHTCEARPERRAVTSRYANLITPERSQRG